MTPARILIVEDELVVGLDLQHRLGELGYQTLAVVPTGEEALAEVDQVTPDLVLMDIKLAGSMDGIETAEKLRQRADVPVVFVTAFADEQTTRRIKAVEPYGYVLKPFHREALRAVVAAALSRHDAMRRLADNVELLVHFSRSLAEEDDPGALPDLLAAAAVQQLGADASVVLTLSTAGELEVAASRNLPVSLADFSADSACIGPELLSRLESACGSSFERSRLLPLISGRDLQAVLVMLFADGSALDEAQQLLGAGLCDITATALADFHRQAELRAAQETMARTEKLRALGQLAAGVSHDLKNVLTPLGLELELIERCLRAGRPVDELIARMRHTLARGVETVDRLRAFGRQERTAGEPVDVNEVVDEAAKLSSARHRAGARDIELRVEHGYPPLVLSDPSELMTSLLNLMVNARDALASQRGGTITVRTSEAGGGACVEVEDDGPGIPAELRKRIFEPSFSTKGKEGTGLGLAMVYAFAQRHGGQITMESAPGKTCFRLWLPRLEEARLHA